MSAVEPAERVHDWVQAHTELEQLAKGRCELDAHEGTALLRALRTGTHQHLGFASFAQYVEFLFGYSVRTTDDKLRTAMALEGLPRLSEMLRVGELKWTGVRELARIATPETEQDWVDAARGKTIRQIEELVSGRVPGDKPSDTPRPEARRRILRFEVRADTYALFREAIASLRRDASEPMDDDALLLLMARGVLGGPSDAGRSSYQVAIRVCSVCGRGFQHGAGADVPVEDDVVAMACCDAQHLPTDPEAQPDGEDVRSETHTGASAPDANSPGPESRPEQTHVGDLDQPGAAEGGPGGTATNQTHVGGRPKLRRSTQSVPPAIRRQVLIRDGGCCVVPGCRHTAFVDVHHLKSRADGGTHEVTNLITVCGAHHRALHRGQLHVEGEISTGLTFLRADWTPYTQRANAHSVAVHESAYRALRSLGFRERDAKIALQRVLKRAAPSVESLLREALSELVPPA